MTAKKLHKKIREPLYQTAKNHVISLINNGDLKEHDPLPPERALGELFSISRMTARQALIAVESEGLAYSDGRKGRFVSPLRHSYNIGNTVSFSLQAQKEHLDLSIEVVSSDIIVTDTNLSEALAVPEGTELFTYRRLFCINQRAAFVEDEYVIAARFPGLLGHNLCQSSTTLLEHQYNTPAHVGDISIRMCSLTGATARLLGVADSQAGMELEQIIRDADGIKFCYGRQYWRGDLAEFSAQAVIKR